MNRFRIIENNLFIFGWENVILIQRLTILKTDLNETVFCTKKPFTKACGLSTWANEKLLTNAVTSVGDTK